MPRIIVFFLTTSGLLTRVTLVSFQNAPSLRQDVSKLHSNVPKEVSKIACGAPIGVRCPERGRSAAVNRLGVFGGQIAGNDLAGAAQIRIWQPDDLPF